MATVDHLTLPGTDLAVAREFYCGLLGATQRMIEEPWPFAAKRRGCARGRRR